MTIELIPLEGLPEIEPGDDLAALLEPSLAANAASDGDVVAITQKVVSKAEGRIVPAEDRAAWIERESVGVVARRGDLVITRTRHGFVCANAGVDASNVREGFLTLLPEDPDASAERLQKELSARLGLTHLGVVITDTFGRPWREGVVDVAIGCAGLPPLHGPPGHRRRPRARAGDHRGGVRRRGGGRERPRDDEDRAGPGGAGARLGRLERATRRRDPRAPWSAHPRTTCSGSPRSIAVAARELERRLRTGRGARRDRLEEAVRAACADPRPAEWSFVAVDSRGRAAPAASPSLPEHRRSPSFGARPDRPVPPACRTPGIGLDEAAILLPPGPRSGRS